MNLPTDTLHKFCAVLGLIMLSASIGHLVVIEDKRAAAQMSAKAAQVEQITLLKQSEKAYRSATELYEKSSTDFELVSSLATAGKLSDADAKRAGAEVQKARAAEYFRQADELFREAGKKEIEVSRLGAIAEDVSSAVGRQMWLTGIVLAFGFMLFGWGILVWARTSKSTKVTTVTPSQNP